MTGKAILLWLLGRAPLVLFAAVFAVFGSQSGRFLEFQNLVNILIQSSSLAVAAVGMTFVLLAAGVDLSVGSVMFVVVAVAGKMIFHEQPIWLAFSAGMLVGFAAGAVNALVITRLRVIAFIATLATLFIARGFGLWLTNTRAMNMPDAVTQLGSSRWLGIPLPVIVMIAVAVLAHWLLTSTPWGRQIYAIGHDAEAARTAGVQVGAILFFVYVVCGACAAVSGLIALTQIGAVSPSFGEEREFAAIAAAVLGGTSLYGGRGSVLPGTLFGAILFQTVENGLVIINADPYLYPLILSGIIFLAVLLDTTRERLVQSLTRRQIRVPQRT
jgi:ribose transport system permease protein